MTHNLKFARNLLLDSFVVGSFMVGLSWLPALGVMVGLVRSLPGSPAKRRPHLALILLCVGLFFVNFLFAWNHGTVLIRTPPEDWLITVCVIAGVLALIGETVCWREDRPQDLPKPDGKA